MRRLQVAILVCTTALSLMGIVKTANALPIIRDMCNQTSGDGQGHSCANPDDLLVRPKYSDGTCGDWMCCPPNGDGTYNCNDATNPKRGAISGALKGLLGPRATVVDPGRNPRTKNPSIFQKPNAPIMRRGIEGESSIPSPAVPEEEGK